VQVNSLGWVGWGAGRGTQRSCEPRPVLELCQASTRLDYSLSNQEKKFLALQIVENTFRLHAQFSNQAKQRLKIPRTLTFIISEFCN